MRISRVALIATAVVAVGGVAAVRAADLFESGTALPPAKAAIEAKIAALRASGSPAPKTGAYESEEPRPAIVAPGGVATGGGYLYSAADSERPPGYPDDTFTNSWYISSPSLNLTVWGAARGSDPTQGFLLVAVWDQARNHLVAIHEIDGASGGGALSIVGADAESLHLVDATGHSLAFNLATLAMTR